MESQSFDSLTGGSGPNKKNHQTHATAASCAVDTGGQCGTTIPGSEPGGRERRSRRSLRQMSDPESLISATVRLVFCFPRCLELFKLQQLPTALSSSTKGKHQAGGDKMSVRKIRRPVSIDAACFLSCLCIRRLISGFSPAALPPSSPLVSARRPCFTSDRPGDTLRGRPAH